MSELVPSNGGLMNRFVSGESGNLNGRPKKWVSKLREAGYKLSEVNDAIQVLMQMDEKELEAAIINPDCTVLELTVAKAIKKSMKRGSLYSIETLLSRVYGKPKETKDERITMVKINVDFNTDEKKLDE